MSPDPLENPGLIAEHLADVGRLVRPALLIHVSTSEHDPRRRRLIVRHRLLDSHQPARQFLRQVDSAVETATDLADKPGTVPAPPGVQGTTLWTGDKKEVQQ